MDPIAPFNRLDRSIRKYFLSSLLECHHEKKREYLTIQNELFITNDF